MGEEKVSEDLAMEIVETVLSDLMARKGFDAVWDESGIDARREIRRTLTRKVLEARTR